MLMGKVSDLSDVIKQYPAESLDELESLSIEIGEDIGSVLRVMLGY